jgi:CubicO group peptidase (beta-lactamase class C family)
MDVQKTVIPSLLVAFASAVLSGCAGTPSTSDRSGGGLSAERLKQFDAVVRADVDKGLIPGFVMLVARDGKVELSSAYGKQDPASGTPMTQDSIFRIYSMTKPIVSVAAMILVEEGRMQLADPVAKFIPELKDLKVGVEKGGTLEIVAARRPITIQDLMRHTSGLTYGVFGKSLVKDLYTKHGVDSWDHTNADLVKKLAMVPLMFQPGSTWEYSRSTDVLGHVIERVTGQNLDRFLDERILKPEAPRHARYRLLRRYGKARSNRGIVRQGSRIGRGDQPDQGARQAAIPVRRRRHGVDGS